MIGAHLTVITDRINTIPMIERNICENASLFPSGSTAMALELDWAAPPPALACPDVIVAADVLYNHSDKVD